MGERDLISGIKRKATAIESSFRFFQTVDLIINHYKREADKQKIFELMKSINKEPTLYDLLIATASIHLYHNLGIRVEDSIEMDQTTIKSTKNLELFEKKILFDEIALILKDSLNLEIDLLYRLIYLENKIISFLIEERKSNLKELQKKRMIKEIEDHIEQDLIEIVLKYPPFYFYDLIGDLVGLTNKIKFEILDESSAFKDLSVEIEKKLKREEKEDKVIELSTLNRLINKVQGDFEFKSYKELQMLAMSVRMIKRKVIDHNFNRFPISIPGLNTFLNANNIKKQLIEKISNALKEKINYDQFEEVILSFLKSEIIKQLKTNPNDFIYFLQNLNENSFQETIYMLNRYGIYNLLHLINTDNDLAQKIKKNMIRYNIDKFDIMNLNNEKKNLICMAKKTICNLNVPFLNKMIKGFEDLNEFSILKLLHKDNMELKELWKILEEKIGYSIDDIREFVRKKEIIDRVFIRDLKLSSYSQVLTLLNFEEIVINIAKQIFFYIFSKILRQISRIIEVYLRITNEKALFLLALKKMYGTTDSEKWIWIKLEELIIDRIIKMQKELVVIFNALNQPFLVNGFIFARLTNTPLNEGISEFKDKPSRIYENIKPLMLNAEKISPVSYCIAYDLIKKFEQFEEKRKLKVIQTIESKEKEKEEKRKEIRKHQEISTLNWIERRITSSLMRINSPGINPNQLYWQEKDTKTAIDNIKLHSELKGNILDLFTEYFHFSIEKIKSHTKDMKLPDQEKLYNIIIEITEKLLEKRLGRAPSSREIENMLEGERFEIAKQIATRIGKILDKALYSKFRRKGR
ncbi:MAG: hypothetical protein ACFFDO_02210 [Candidatus Thorarchaeota archaeon]